MKKYYTGIKVEINSKCKSSYSGRGFKIFLKKYNNRDTGSFNGNKIIQDKNVIISCNSLERAYNVAQLIYESDVIIRGGEILPLTELSILDSVQEIDKNFYPQNNHIYSTDFILPAIIMTSKASFDHKNIWAIHKLFLSYRLISIPIIDLNPSFNSNVIDKPILKKYLPDINFAIKAFAIIFAYSAIEELRLHTKVSKTFKAWEKNNKADLIIKLKESKINLLEKFEWILMGTKNYLETNLPGINILKKQKTQWNNGNIKGIEIDISDAIYLASFLRNKVCAHVFSSSENYKRFKTLSVYEVSNVQLLARRLILEKLRLWRSEYLEKD